MTTQEILKEIEIIKQELATQDPISMNYVLLQIKLDCLYNSYIHLTKKAA